MSTAIRSTAICTHPDCPLFEARIAELLATPKSSGTAGTLLSEMTYYLTDADLERRKQVQAELVACHGAYSDFLREHYDDDAADYHATKADYMRNGFAAYYRMGTVESYREDRRRSEEAQRRNEEYRQRQIEKARKQRQRAKLLRPVRAAAGCTGKPWPVVIVDGDGKPSLKGESYHFTTPGGRPVYYPNAYRRAYGKPVYNASTLHIEVGREWLAKNGISVEE